MTIPISNRTKNVAKALFSEPDLSRILKRLETDVSENIPSHEDSSPEEMERIRFSILKLIVNHPEYEDSAFKLAQEDWRDLFMNAGFGYSAIEHENWYQKIIKGKS